MSDYLGNIVARSLNIVDVVRPRQPSMFERTELGNWRVFDHALTYQGDETYTGEPMIDMPTPTPTNTPQSQTPTLTMTDLKSASGIKGSELQRTFSIPLKTVDQQHDRPKSSLQRDELHPEDQKSLLHLTKPHTPPPSPALASNKSQKEGRLMPSGHDLNEVDRRNLQAPVNKASPLEPVIASRIEASAKDEEKVQQSDPSVPQTSPVRTHEPASTSARYPISGRSESKTEGAPKYDFQISKVFTEQRTLAAIQPPARSVSSGIEQVPLLNTAGPERSSVIIDAVIRPEGSMQETQTGITAQPQVRRYVETAAPAPAVRDTSINPTPDVQVSIGRIEVRATSPPVPQLKRERPKPPVISLDEYLTKRNNRGNQ